MNPQQRQQYAKIGLIAVVGLVALNWLIITPVLDHWSEQGKQIETLRERVRRGHALLNDQNRIRERWAEMSNTDLPPENSAAEDAVFKGINRWQRDSHILITNFQPQWRTMEGYEVYECRAAAQGDQASLGRLLYELEADPLPVRLEDCEFSTRDKTGKQLSLTMRFSFVRLAETGGGSR